MNEVEQLIGVPVTPTRSPVDEWTVERDRLSYPPGHVEQTRGRTVGFVPLLVHADRLVTDTEDSIWMSPDGDRTEIPDRQPIGSHTDPTGETAIDPRREQLKSAIELLVYDPVRRRKYADLLQDLNDTLIAHRLAPVHYPSLNYNPRPGNLLTEWKGQHATLTEYAHNAADHINLLAQYNEKAVRTHARNLHTANDRFNATLSAAATAYRRYHGGDGT